MKFEDMADFLEEFKEHLQIKGAHWLFTEYSKYEDRDVRVKIIREFIDWVCEDTNKDLNVKRRGGSYIEARAERELQKIPPIDVDNLKAVATSWTPAALEVENDKTSIGIKEEPGQEREGMESIMPRFDGIPEPPNQTGC